MSITNQLFRILVTVSAPPEVEGAINRFLPTKDLGSEEEEEGASRWFPCL
jgi:hypothetical protein